MAAPPPRESCTPLATATLTLTLTLALALALTLTLTLTLTLILTRTLTLTRLLALIEELGLAAPRIVNGHTLGLWLLFKYR